MDPIFLIDRKLLPKKIVALLVDPTVAFFFGASIHWTKLAIPDLLCVSNRISGLSR